MARDRGVWVTGTGRAAGPQDECVLTVAAEVRRPTAADALAACAEALAAMREALLGQGVQAASLATSGVDLSPLYAEYPTVAGFQAAVQLTARTGAVEAVGQLLTAAVSAGGDAARVNQVAFGHSDPAALMAAARDAAWADARARATQLARLAGRELGEVVAIEESGGHLPRPVMAKLAMDAESAAGLPIDSGESVVVVGLTVGWSLL